MFGQCNSSASQQVWQAAIPYSHFTFRGQVWGLTPSGLKAIYSIRIGAPLGPPET